MTAPSRRAAGAPDRLPKCHAARGDLFGRGRFQIAQEPFQAPPIFRCPIPPPEIADVALVTQLYGPWFGSRHDLVVNADRE